MRLRITLFAVYGALLGVGLLLVLPSGLWVFAPLAFGVGSTSNLLAKGMDFRWPSSVRESALIGLAITAAWIGLANIGILAITVLIIPFCVAFSGCGDVPAPLFGAIVGGLTAPIVAWLSPSKSASALRYEAYRSARLSPTQAPLVVEDLRARTSVNPDTQDR